MKFYIVLSIQKINNIICTNLSIYKFVNVLVSHVFPLPIPALVFDRHGAKLNSSVPQLR